nr:PP2C family protein-serine/threonine phosphatase [Streptomyces sp. SID4946]
MPLHLDQRGAVHPLDCPGGLIGISDEAYLTTCHLHLEPTESLLLYTDGITEARNHDREQFGEERLTQALGHASSPLTAQQTIDTLTGAVHAFTGPHGVHDDQAALVLTATPPAGRP